MIKTIDDIMFITDNNNPYRIGLLYGKGGLGYKPTIYNMVGGTIIESKDVLEKLKSDDIEDIERVKKAYEKGLEKIEYNEDYDEEEKEKDKDFLEKQIDILNNRIEIIKLQENEKERKADEFRNKKLIEKAIEGFKEYTEEKKNERKADIFRDRKLKEKAIEGFKEYTEEKKNERKADKFREKKDKEKEEMNKRLIFDVLKVPYEEMKEKEIKASEFREKQLINRVGKPFIESMKTDQLEKLDYFEPEKTPDEMFNTLRDAKKDNNINLPNGLALEELTKKTNEWGQPLKDALNDNSNIKGFEDEIKNNIPTIYHQSKYKFRDKFPWEWVHIDLTQDKNLTDSKAYIFLRDGSSAGVDFEETNDKFNKYCYELRKKLIDEEKNNNTSQVRKNEIKNILSSQQNFENEIIRRNDYPYILITRGKITGLNEGSSSNMTENIYGVVNGKPKVIGVKFNYYPIFDPTINKPKFIPVNKYIQSKINKDLNYDMLTNRGRYLYKVLDDNNFVLSNDKGRLKYNTIVDKNISYYKVFPNKFIQMKTTK